jgi:WD40 repeat protein
MPRYSLSGAILKLTSRRVTALAFPPDSDATVVAGDKRGQVAVWNIDDVSRGGGGGAG